MKTTFLLGLLCLSSYVFSFTASDSTKTALKKNEIGLNLSGPFHSGRSELVYKRAGKNNVYWRASMHYITKEFEFPRNRPVGNYISGQPVALGPSSYTVQRIEEKGYKAGAALGVEKRKNVKNFVLFYGADLALGKTESNTSVFEDKMKIEFDTIPNGTYSIRSVSLATSLLVGEQHTRGIYYGIRPFGGIMVPLGEHFYVSTQVTLNVAMENNTVDNFYFISSYRQPQKVSTLNFDTEMLLNNISLFYRF